MALPAMSTSIARNAKATTSVCQDCVLRKASLASGGTYIPCFVHEPEEEYHGSLVASDLIFSFGGREGLYFYSTQYQISSTK